MANVFVYGTLMPGDVRWRHIEPYVAHLHRSSTSGRIFDTGLDYPAARFDLDGDIQGWVLEIPDNVAPEALELLDEIEGVVEGGYHRVEVTAADGTACWSYQFGGDPNGLRDLEGVWSVFR